MFDLASPASQGFDADRLARIQTWMDRYVEERKFPGSSIVVARGGQPVFTATAGRRSVENDLPFELDTITRIYSMTKPIASVALMTLVEEGAFHLDAPISAFIPEFKTMEALIPGATRADQTEPAPCPTLHQALTHTSGLSYPFNPGLAAQIYDDRKLVFGPSEQGLAAQAASAATIPLAFQPGARWEYSIGIDIIGRVIEVATGQPLDVALRERVLGPLGMEETSFSITDDKLDRFASLYTPLDGDPIKLGAKSEGGETLRLVDEPETSPLRQTRTLSGGGGLLSTLSDYLRFAEMLRRGGELDGARILSPRTLDFMMRNHLPGDIASMGPQSFAEMPMQGMGFGIGGSVVLDPARCRMPGSVGDFSWGGMASTIFWVDRTLDLSVVFFTQLTPSSSYPNRPELKALVHGALTN